MWMGHRSAIVWSRDLERILRLFSPRLPRLSLIYKGAFEFFPTWTRGHHSQEARTSVKGHNR